MELVEGKDLGHWLADHGDASGPRFHEAAFAL